MKKEMTLMVGEIHLRREAKRVLSLKVVEEEVVHQKREEEVRNDKVAQ